MPRVSIKDMDQSFELEENEVIFDGLERQGQELPHGCLAGSCGSCRIEVIEGAENLKPASTIEQDTIEAVSEEYEQNHGEGTLSGKTVRLSCRARILTGSIIITPLK